MKSLMKKHSIKRLISEATNKDHWGPSNQVMFQIAQLSFCDAKTFNYIYSKIWSRVDQRKHVRRSQKAMILLEFLIINGNERFRNETKLMLVQLENLTTIHSHKSGEKAMLEEVIRTKSKRIIDLVLNDDNYKSERQKGANLKRTLTSVTDHHLAPMRTYKGGVPIQVVPSARPPPQPKSDDQSSDYYSSDDSDEDSDVPLPTSNPFAPQAQKQLSQGALWSHRRSGSYQEDAIHFAATTQIYNNQPRADYTIPVNPYKKEEMMQTQHPAVMPVQPRKNIQAQQHPVPHVPERTMPSQNTQMNVGQQPVQAQPRGYKPMNLAPPAPIRNNSPPQQPKPVKISNDDDFVSLKHVQKINEPYQETHLDEIKVQMPEEYIEEFGDLAIVDFSNKRKRNIEYGKPTGIRGPTSAIPAIY